jgi:hypothetical protein
LQRKSAASALSGLRPRNRMMVGSTSVALSITAMPQPAAGWKCPSGADFQPMV